MHSPCTQTVPAPQATPSHASGGGGVTHERLQTLPAGHAPSHAWMGTHAVAPPPAATHRVPAAHATFAQGDGGKHPSMHTPPAQVVPGLQVTPVQGSTVRTQDASHVAGAAHAKFVLSHGSAAQRAPRHTCPAPHSASSAHAVPMATPALSASGRSASSLRAASRTPASRAGRTSPEAAGSLAGQAVSSAATPHTSAHGPARDRRSLQRQRSPPSSPVPRRSCTRSSIPIPPRHEASTRRFLRAAAGDQVVSKVASVLRWRGLIRVSLRQAPRVCRAAAPDS